MTFESRRRVASHLGSSRRATTTANVSVPLFALFEALSDGILITDDRGQRTYANAALNRLVGADATQPADSDAPPPWVPNEHVATYLEYATLERLGANGDPVLLLDWPLQHADGEIVPAVAHILPARSPSGAATALVWVIQADETGTAAQPGPRLRMLEAAMERFGAEIARLGVGVPTLPMLDPADFPGSERLSKREFEIVSYLMRGGRVVTIAGELGVSQHTVRNHLKSVFRKLDVHSQAELVRHISGR